VNDVKKTTYFLNRHSQDWTKVHIYACEKHNQVHTYSSVEKKNAVKDANISCCRSYQCSTLEDQLICYWIFLDGSGKTNATAPESGGLHSSWCNIDDMLQKWTFCNTRISHLAYVQVSSDLCIYISVNNGMWTVGENKALFGNESHTDS